MLMNFKNTFLSQNKMILIVFCISILLALFPLTSVFGYEFAVIQAIILSYIFGLIGIKFDFSNWNKIKHKFIYEIVVLLTLPIIISIISTKLNQNCPLAEGFQFYFVITIPSAIFGFAIGNFISSVLGKWKKLIFTLFWFASLLFPVVEIYFNPQIYIFNPILGFFPGTIYDEDIAISLKLVSYRTIILLFTLFTIYLSVKIRKIKKSNKVILFLAMGLSIIIFLFIIKPAIGFAADINSLKSELKGEIETPHFRIIYSSRIPRKKIKNIALHHEYYFQVLSSVLDDSLTEKITSFIFYDKHEKRELFGAGNADVAKPWLNQIYITREHYDTTLKHELAHVFSAKYGWSIFKVAKWFNPAMIEGFAMALQNNFGDSDIDYVAADAKKNGMNLNIKNLFSGFNFFGQTSSISYVYAGSFIKYLMYKYGAEQVKKVYSDMNFQKHFNKNITELSVDFENYLSTFNTTSSKSKVQLYFKRKPIQKRICVRYTANKLNEAWKLYKVGAYSQAANMFMHIYKYSGAYSALLGEALSLKSNSDVNIAEKLFYENLKNFEGTSYYFSLLKNLGDMQILNKHFDSADSTFALLKKMRPSQDYYNIALLRLKMLKTDSTSVEKYLKGSIFDKYNILRKPKFKNIKFNLIPIITMISEQINQRHEDFIADYINISFDSTYSSAYSAFNLSKYAKDNDDFNSAVYFAEKALLLKGRNGYKEILKANLQKDLWMNKNSKNYYDKMKFSE